MQSLQSQPSLLLYLILFLNCCTEMEFLEMSAGSAVVAKATFTLLRFQFHPFLLIKELPVHIAPFSNEYATKTIGVQIAPAKRCC